MSLLPTSPSMPTSPVGVASQPLLELPVLKAVSDKLAKIQMLAANAVTAAISGCMDSATAFLAMAQKSSAKAQSYADFAEQVGHEDAATADGVAKKAAAIVCQALELVTKTAQGAPDCPV